MDASNVGAGEAVGVMQAVLTKDDRSLSGGGFTWLKVGVQAGDGWVGRGVDVFCRTRRLGKHFQWREVRLVISVCMRRHSRWPLRKMILAQKLD